MQQDVKQDFIDHLKQVLGLSDSKAEDFLEWMDENNWESFDGMGVWINTKTYRRLDTTPLYGKYILRAV